MKQIAAMPRIYKTDLFYNKYELQARNNLRNEISGL
jgi:predicted metal-dependent HD superfamily phosphohydrolase